MGLVADALMLDFLACIVAGRETADKWMATGGLERLKLPALLFPIEK
jgi:hypothetical protein